MDLCPSIKNLVVGIRLLEFSTGRDMSDLEVFKASMHVDEVECRVVKDFDRCNIEKLVLILYEDCYDEQDWQEHLPDPRLYIKVPDGISVSSITPRWLPESEDDVLSCFSLVVGDLNRLSNLVAAENFIWLVDRAHGKYRIL